MGSIQLGQPAAATECLWTFEKSHNPVISILTGGVLSALSVRRDRMPDSLCAGRCLTKAIEVMQRGN